MTETLPERRPEAPIDHFRGRYDFLSNFFPCAVEFEGVRYPSTEHAYQAAKSLDPVDRLAAASIHNPGQVKAFGRRLVKLRADWEDVKLSVMETVLRAKFNPKGTPEQRDLAQRLRATGSRQLIEGNTWGDTFWGVCTNASRHTSGENHLGRLLMNVRWSLIEEPPLHGVFRKPRALLRGETIEPVVVKSWAVNVEHDEKSFRQYACGLVIVSLPGAMHGVDESVATPEQLATAARVREVIDTCPRESFTESVLAAFVAGPGRS